MLITVDIYYGESEEATLVPLSALYENPLSGVTGVYVSQTMLDREPVGQLKTDGSALLTDPIPFKFVPVDIVAKGRMEAGIRGVNPDEWIITLGQNLLGGQPGEARVRAVKWDWVQKLQHLQREDLMEEMVRKHQAFHVDTVSAKQ